MEPDKKKAWDTKVAMHRKGYKHLTDENGLLRFPLCGDKLRNHEVYLAVDAELTELRSQLNAALAEKGKN